MVYFTRCTGVPVPFFQVRNAGRNPSAADDKLCEQYETKIAKDDDPDSSCRWEEAASIRRMVLPVLKKYADAPKVIVIGHGMMIEAVTGAPHPKCGEIVPFSLVGKE